MHKVEQSPIGATLVASKFPDFNFNTLPYLQIANHSTTRELNQTDSLLKFNVNPSICIDEFEITKAVLYLPLENCHPFAISGFQELALFRNTSEFFSHTVTWNTRPSTELYQLINLEREDLSNGIYVDITDLAIDWKENPHENFGLTLSTPTRNFTLNMCKRGPNSPKLIICYDYDDDRCCERKNKSIGIQLQASNLCQRTLQNNQPILFNDIVSRTKTGVKYHSSSGIIHLEQPGDYVANWWVSLTPFTASTEFQFALINNTTLHLIRSCSPIVSLGNMSGNALIHVEHPDQTFSLINHSGGSVQLGTTTIQASLVLNKI